LSENIGLLLFRTLEVFTGPFSVSRPDQPNLNFQPDPPITSKMLSYSPTRPTHDAKNWIFKIHY